ncbi:hypothetical protein Aperf_G00000122939 [Anoplocephala perfoliata]
MPQSRWNCNGSFQISIMQGLVEATSEAPILLVEAFNGGSHKQLISSLERLILEKGKQACVITLPASKWHWRARTGALALAGLIPKNITGVYRVLFTSAVFSLPELLALRPDLAAIPRKYLYFHENQLAYPLREGETKLDYQFAYIQVLSALVADVVLFNSAYNMHSFYERLPAFLTSGLATPPSPRVPDPQRLVETALKPKSAVLYFLVEPPPLEVMFGGSLQDAVAKQAERIKARGKEPLSILWNHRWDYDKNPADFFRVIFELAGIDVAEEFFDLGKNTLRPSAGDNNISSKADSGPLSSEKTSPNFQLTVIGGSTQDIPRIFHMAEPLLTARGHVRSWGYLDSREAYWRALADCDVVVSTANHEFFGVSVAEAVSMGCIPLVPQRLAYPELVNAPICLYRTLAQMKKQLKRWIDAPDRLRVELSTAFMANFQISGDYVHRSGEFAALMSSMADQSVANPQTYPLQSSNTIVKMEDPNIFANFAVKIESPSTPISNIVFPPDFNQQQRSVSSPSTATSNENNANRGLACDTCGKVFENRSLLAKHKVSHQPRDRLCPTCGRAFARDDKLRRHILSVHSSERPHVCEVCGKGFARKDKLQEHARHHNKNITFPCSVCEETFNMRSKLNRHLREYHNIRQSNRPSREQGKPQSGSKKKKDRSEPVEQTIAVPTTNINASGLFQNPANFFWYNSYQRQPQLNPSHSAFDFWNAQNAHGLYGQQYGYNVNHLYYAAAAIRQNPQQSSAIAAHMFSQAAASNPTLLQAAASGYWSTNFGASVNTPSSTTTDVQQLAVASSRASQQQQQVMFNNGSYSASATNTPSSYPSANYYDAASLAARLGQQSSQSVPQEAQASNSIIAYGYTQ